MMTLGEQVKDAQRVVNSWSPEKRATVQLEGSPNYKVRADDIKRSGRLTDDQVADISTSLVYEWVRTGKWTQRDFKVWLRAIRVEE